MTKMSFNLMQWCSWMALPGSVMNSDEADEGPAGVAHQVNEV